MRPTNIHQSSTISEFVSVDPLARIGPNCHIDGKITIHDGAFLTGGITLVGDAVVGGGTVMEPGVCIARPQPTELPESSLVEIGRNVHLGAGAVLLGGVKIGHSAWIEPGTVVVRNIPAYAIVGGNPAAIRGYLNDEERPDSNSTKNLSPAGLANLHSSVRGVRVFHFPRVRDLRGDLSVGEFGRNVPFTPKRYFIVYDVPSTETRGEHAHKKCDQFLICVAGSVSVIVDDGANREEVLLDQPHLGLLIPSGIWGVQYKYSADGILLVFASEYYDPGDYIRNYDEFLQLSAGRT